MAGDIGKGQGKRFTGKVKETVGRAIGNERQEAKGKAEHAKGVVQENFGKVKRDIKKKLK
jgi:uncharacterized protein YjbJ (UPF0337 family)